jgi:hypothetical protein
MDNAARVMSSCQNPREDGNLPAKTFISNGAIPHLLDAAHPCQRLLRLRDHVLPLENSGAVPVQQVATSLGSRWKRAAFTAPDSSARLKAVEIRLKVPLPYLQGT